MAGLIVRRVNACDRAIASEVNRLQRLTLPSDSPCTLAGAMWWLVYDGSQPVAFAGLRRSAQFCDAGYLCRAGCSDNFNAATTSGWCSMVSASGSTILLRGSSITTAPQITRPRLARSVSCNR